LTSGGFMGGFYRFGEAVLFLMYVNALWIVFTLMGGIIIGWAPSTIAMFAVVRKWVRGETDRPVFKTFWDTYRTEFLKANGLGWFLLIIGYMLYFNLNYFQVNNGWIFLIVRYFILAVALFYVIMLLYIFPIFVHYEAKFFHYIKNAFLIAFYHPIRTIYVVSASITVYYLFAVLPGLLPFLGGSLTSFVLMWISHRTFLRIEDKQRRWKEQQGKEC
jgi:uncharacterized membrane protein YesL